MASYYKNQVNPFIFFVTDTCLKAFGHQYSKFLPSAKSVLQQPYTMTTRALLTEKGEPDK